MLFREMIEQAEVVGGGATEPILNLVPFHEKERNEPQRTPGSHLSGWRFRNGQPPGLFDLSAAARSSRSNRRDSNDPESHPPAFHHSKPQRRGEVLSAV